MEVGSRVRELRKRVGISMKELAKRVGVSTLSIYRIETEKTSPSVALLSDIAQCLNYPISSFLTQGDKKVVLMKAKEQRVIKGDNLELRLIAPRGVIDKNISITVGRAGKGDFIGKHKHVGYEMAYMLKGSCIFRHGNQEYELREGDFLYFDSTIPHSVTALEPHEFFGIHFINH